MTIHEMPLELVVDEVIVLTDTITEFHLRDPAGQTLPPFSAGAHLRVQVEPGGTVGWRHYSLVNADATPGATEAPRAYRIAVRRDDGGQGGSLWMHTQVKAGSRMVTSAPIQGFPLDASADDAVLIAGGIGVTPIVSMAAALSAAGRHYSVHYSARNPDQLAFVDELEVLAGPNLKLYADEGSLPPLNLDALLAGMAPTQRIYVCGPAGMIDAVLALAPARGWAREAIHFELFSAPPADASADDFEVELRHSGQVLIVPAGQTILDAMLAAGLDPLYDCKRGECGVCLTTVVEGEVEHRDYCLSEAQRRAGDVMQICVSRARGRRLVLDA